MASLETLRRTLGDTLPLLAMVSLPFACAGAADGDGADGDSPRDEGGAGGEAGDDGAELPDYSSRPRGRARPGGAFVHLFEWRWVDVALECERFLGPRGFAAVQLSPSNAHAVLPNRPWYERYQPASYELESRSGTREEFVDMVRRCDEAGVDVYVDAVINHMTAQESGVDSAGASYTKYEYAGLYGEEDFHLPACTIQGSDYASDAEAVRNCELVGLADLRTEDDSVRERIADYLAEYVELGVRGFRIDAAKHMNPEDLRAILQKVSERVGVERAPYYFLEVIDPGGEAIGASEYLDVAGESGSTVDVTDFRYQTQVSQAFLYAESSAMLFTLAELDEAKFLPSERAVAFTNNHDTQRNDAVVSYQSGAYDELASVFLLAWPYGYPQLMSSFTFSRQFTAKGPPSDEAGETLPVYPDADGEPACLARGDRTTTNAWVCEHQNPIVAEMVGFRIDVAGEPVTNVWTNGGNRLAFGRGARGFVVINAEVAPLSERLATSLPPGRYCDRLSGGRRGDRCRGAEIVVDAEGEAQLEVAGLTAVALDERGRLP